MFTFEGKCPHCGSDRGFHAFGISPYLAAVDDYRAHPLIMEQLQDKTCPNPVNNSVAEYSLAGTCLNCKKPVVASCASTVHARTEIANSLGHSERYAKNKVLVLHIFPEPTPPYTHYSLPPAVSESFIDLQKMLQEKRQPHLIIMGCRAVLEAAVRALDDEEGNNGLVLWERIEKLHRQGIITTSLKEWASIIRRVGNKAAHEMAGTEEEARELVAFTKVFLQFTFELPAIIAATRTKPNHQ